jgi:hypothetical protein
MEQRADTVNGRRQTRFSVPVIPGPAPFLLSPQAGGGTYRYFAPGVMIARTSAMISGAVA